MISVVGCKLDSKIAFGGRGVDGVRVFFDFEAFPLEVSNQFRETRSKDYDVGVECIDRPDIAVTAKPPIKQYGPNFSQAAISRARSLPPPLVVNSYASSAVTDYSVHTASNARRASVRGHTHLIAELDQFLAEQRIAGIFVSQLRQKLL